MLLLKYGYGPAVLDTTQIAHALAASPVAHVAVAGRQGPHVTPQLAVVAAGRLWFATPHGSLKAEVLRSRPGVGVLATSVDGRALVVRGEAAVLDAGDPLGLVRHLDDAIRSGPAMAAYALRNGDEVMATIRDALSFDLGTTAFQRRVLVAVQPSAVLEGGRPGAAVLGRLTDEGPVALPAGWDPVRSVATVDAALWDAVGAPDEGPACVTVSADDGPGARQKQGTLLRGDGTATVVDGQVEVRLDPARATWWDGAESATVALR